MYIVIITPTSLNGGVQPRGQSGHIVKEFTTKEALNEFLKTGGGNNPTIRIFEATEMSFKVDVNLTPKHSTFSNSIYR